jgi:type IV pilus assembly protein PilP
MQTNFLKVSAHLFIIMLLSISLNATCWANTSGKPVVVRKKIFAQSEKATLHKNFHNAAPDHKTRIPGPKSDISPLKKESEDKNNFMVDARISNQVARLYDPSDKIDPFEPLFKETPKIKSGSPTYAYTGRKRTTALEKIDLSQLRLTGIIVAGSGNKGLVQEASGRGHVISEGTPIGTHGGRVAGILKDLVIVEEKMKDVAGRLFFQKTELKLNKPDS